ncbi:hypothetical protein [Streptomyces chryseus]
MPGWPYSFVAACSRPPTSRPSPPPLEVVERLIAADQWADGDPEILVVLDAGFDAPRIAHFLADLPVQILGRAPIGPRHARLAQVRFWPRTGDTAFTARIRDCADGLLATATADLVWPVAAGFDSQFADKTHYGFAHGSADIGHFLLTAGLALDEEQFLPAAAARAPSASSRWPGHLAQPQDRRSGPVIADCFGLLTAVLPTVEVPA